MLREVSATKIQKVYRGKLDRELYKVLTPQLTRTENKKKMCPLLFPISN